MVQLITNAPRFKNDIAEEIRLFLGMVDIEETGEDPELICTVTLEEKEAVCLLMPGGTEGRAPVMAYEGALDEKRQQKRAVKLCTYRAMQQRFEMPMPWGSLTGIRPTKLYREILHAKGQEEADREFRELFTVSPEKLALTQTITRVQRPYIASAGRRDVDVYLGIPYCKTRCLYCSFGAEIAKKEEMLDAYVAHIKQDIAQGAAMLRELGYTLRCTYFGGGTPTVLSAGQLFELLTFARAQYGGFGAEFTVEAGRPDTITSEKLRVLKDCGVSRISINPQTMQDKTLRTIGRFHTGEDIRRAFAQAREAGFTSINMDVIAGLPGETLEDFASTLTQIREMGPENLTVHTLAIKRSSRLKERLEEYPLPDGETAEAMVRLGADEAARMGMEPYYMYRQKYMNGNLENVGYARPGTECMYNIDMMEETVSILAHGAGAMTKRVYGGENRVERLPNPKDVPTYFAKLPRLFEGKQALFE